MSAVEDLAPEARRQLGVVLDDCGAEQASALRAALVEGRIDGRTFWSVTNRCGCVLGTLAWAGGASDPAQVAHERWEPAATFELEAFASPVRPGEEADTEADWREYYGPGRAAELVRWIDEWMSERSVSA